MSEFSLPVPSWNNIPPIEVTGIARLLSDNQVVIGTSEGEMHITFFDCGVRILMGKERRDDYQILYSLPQREHIALAQDDEEIRITSEQFELLVNISPFHFRLYKSGELVQSSTRDGHFVREYRLPPLAKVDEGWFVALDLDNDEAVYGLGEKWGKLNKRGQLIRSFNSDALGVNAEISYKNTPFAWSPDGWGVFVHTPAPVTHGVGYAPWSQRAYGILVEDETLDVFLFAEKSGAELIDTYTQLTGRAPVPPDWSLGVILSKAYYKDVAEVLSTARTVRDNKMPCDVITLDGRAWQDTDTRFAFEWDPKRYQDPAALVKELKSMGFKVCVWEYPLVSVQNPLFKEMADKGWLLKDSRTQEAYRYQWDMSAFGETLTPLPESGIVDFTHPDAYTFWRDSHKPLFDLGIDMIKADFGEQVEDNNMLAHNGESGIALHNVYSLLYNRCVYEAAQMYSQTRAFLFSRSAWTGSQRYPSQWGGDPQADWGGFAANIRGGLSWGLSGGPYYATDVGGFYKDTRDAELFVRWAQAAIFSAHYRLHGIGQREPWSYGEEAAKAATKALQLRYRLLPYIKKVVIEASKSGLPVQRAMVLACPEDPASWPFESQFMFGGDLLVAPCFKPGGDVQVYLPEGDWVMLQDGREFNGGRVHRLNLKLDEIAVFVKRGTQIPLAAPGIEHLEHNSLDVVEYWSA